MSNVCASNIKLNPCQHLLVYAMHGDTTTLSTLTLTLPYHTYPANALITKYSDVLGFLYAMLGNNSLMVCFTHHVVPA